MKRNAKGQFIKKETAESLRARYIVAGEEIRANEVTIEARKAEIAQLQKEREELREKVRALGFDFWDSTKDGKENALSPDFWKSGDVVKCIKKGVDLTLGKLYTLREDYSTSNGWVRIESNDRGHKDGYDVGCFKFHSRPSK